MPEARLKVLISAFACRPGEGSEPAVGWEIVREISKYHDVWVITRERNREAIEHCISELNNVRFVYFKWSVWPSAWEANNYHVRAYYYLWQLLIISRIKKLNDGVGFDLCHHLTYVKYWAPCGLAWLGIPFVWGPVGGGDDMPHHFLRSCSIRTLFSELGREFLRKASEYDPLVRKAAKNCSVAIAVTRATELRIRAMGVSNVVRMTQVGLTETQLSDGCEFPDKDNSADSLQLLFVGNLLYLKGVHLIIKAIEKIKCDNFYIYVIGDGPEMTKLTRMVEKKRLQKKIIFLGRKSRGEVMRIMSESSVLVHPSLHDSGGFVLVEAMTYGLPIICLDLAGPSEIVNKKFGIKVCAGSEEEAVNGLRDAIQLMVKDKSMKLKMSEASLLLAKDFSWKKKASKLNSIYQSIIQP